MRTANPRSSEAAGRGAWLTLAVVAGGLFLAVMSTTLVSVALPTIGRDLHASATDLQWIVDAYVLVYASLLVAGGVIGDRRGRKGVFMLGVTLFAAGSLLTGLASSIGVLLIGRVLQGLGPALLIPGSLTIIRATFEDPQRRAFAIGLWSMASGLSLAVGPALGGLIVSGIGWRWVFLINVPLAGVLLALAALFVPRLASTPAHSRFDWLGAFLTTAAVGALAYGVIHGQVAGLTSASALVAFAAGIAALVAFVGWERHRAEPLVDVSLFLRPAFAAANIAALIVFFSFVGAIVYFSAFFQQVQGRSPISAGVDVSAIGVAFAFASPLSGRLVGRVGPLMPMLAGLSIAGGATLGLLRLGAHTGTGPLLLLAGPGAGKTKTLTHRAAYLLATGRARPWEILAVTFSVRAAGELRLRLADLLGENVARGVLAATFHSVCARLLREHASVFGRTERYTIYDQGDMRRVIDWLLSDADRGQIQRALADYGQPASAEVLGEISRAKNLLLSPDSYEESASHRGARLIAEVWRESETELRRSNAWDFDDLLAFAVRLLGEQPHRLAWLRQRWRWIIVDEFPDTSHAQATLVDLLAGPDGNVCVCGDDDQLIHGWRHADLRHVLCFDERHPGAVQIVLGRNFRSRAEILDAAVSCVSHNERRTPKALIAIRGAGGQVRVAGIVNEHQEAHWVAGQIANGLASGIPASEILALARTGYATEPPQRALAHAGIAHRVLGSLGLYERTEVRDALAYLTLLQNLRDAQAFARAIVSPRRAAASAQRP